MSITHFNSSRGEVMTEMTAPEAAPPVTTAMIPASLRSFPVNILHTTLVVAKPIKFRAIPTAMGLERPRKNAGIPPAW